MTKKELYDIIYGFALGDALGVPFEFSEKKKKEMRKLKLYGGGVHLQEKGVYSDDTALTLASMDNLASNDYSPKKLFKSFKIWYEEGAYSATGYAFDVGISTKRVLKEPYIEKHIGFDDNEGNGSLMRIIPFALWNMNEDFKVRKNAIYEASSITHASYEACYSCLIYSELLIKLLKENKPKEEIFKELHDELKKEIPEKYSFLFSLEIAKIKEEMIKPSGHVSYTLQTVFWVFLNYDSYEDALKEVIKLGGDTDTIGALTGALMALKYPETFPSKLVKKLKNKDFIDAICEKYFNAFTSKEQSPKA